MAVVHMSPTDLYSLAYFMASINRGALDPDNLKISSNIDICDCSVERDGLATCIIMCNGEYLHLSKEEIDDQIEKMFDQDLEEEF